MPELPKAVEADRHEFTGRSGGLSYYVAGDGPPILLVHSINAAGSVYEVRPVFEHFRTTRRVYAPDLPGFGFSERSDRHYDSRLYTDAIHDMLEHIAADCGDSPADALALSLASEFLARAASEAPSHFRTVALVTPTGFTAGSERLREEEGANREVPLLHSVLTVPLWRRGLYNLLVSPRSIRYFLKRTWGSDDYDEGLAAYDDLTTHQPGAENAPYAFLSGRLFSKDIRDVYERLRMPVWLAHGTKGDFSDFRGAEWTADRENWTVDPFDTGALPHFERPDEFFSAYQDFLATADGDD
ncbi:MAG: alpha/beta hydrolase [Gammaproteobacteria bacterium]